MFDEIDERTAIFKYTNNIPISDHVLFLKFEGVTSDHYL